MIPGVRRVHLFGYAAKAHKEREPQAHSIINAEAARYLSDALVDHGYRAGGTIFNYAWAGPHVAPLDGIPFTADDLVLMVTRPPIHDLAIGDRRGIARSSTALEKRLFDGPFREVFDYCARSQITLTNRLASISPEVAARQTMLFRQNGGAAYQAYGSPRARLFTRFASGDRRTAAFLVYVEHAWRGGPGLLAAFGVDGMETLVWCRFLQARFGHLLLSHAFVMAEMAAEMPARPPTLAFADTWDVQILGTAPVGFFDGGTPGDVDSARNEDRDLATNGPLPPA